MSKSTLHLMSAILAALVISLALAPSSNARNTGGVTLYTNTDTGGVPDDAQIPSSAPAKKPAKKKPAKRRKRKPRAKPPVLTGFALGSRALFDEGRPIPMMFRIKARARQVRVKLIVRGAGGTYITTVDLGVFETGKLQTVNLGRSDLRVDRPGSYKLRLSAADGKGRRAARAAKVRAWLPFSYATHRFPIAGDFSWGGEDARFGADRPGHKHQGQDLVAAEGQPVVAPHAGTITWVKYQAGGAGHYVVLDGENEDRDYVFMHLKSGSVAVKEKDVVRTGQLLGRVGSTGASSGPHLHFEIWTGGPWQLGGRPVDPLPLLQSWYRNAGGQARALNLPHDVDGRE